ncbi:flagellar motor switch protein FliN [Arthrobacter glacialis]|uniref:Flagellar motor switch protein FliN n=1 Tax=Arthrobacter glacialis TaxID=1664 RepID=A0A2S3ZX54_ARTGL|nr:flagellar motor switch protein FliN [Arthrobacter glacialis]POH59378.1 flagellar motor switch protein FliN [Arthrobacter glacialis]POH73856.1 flagellar motor switch protein FliN [Arthrobacter glacialis]
MSTTLATQAAASALVTLLPSPSPLSASLQPAGAVPAGTMGVAVDYVGPQSAELALVLSSRAADSLRVAGGAGPFSLADVLRPAFEAATAELGSGVLGEVSEHDSAALFADSGAAVFQVLDGGAGQDPFAWLAIKIRNSAGNGGGELSAAKLGRIHDVEMALSVVIGRTRMSVANVLGLEPGNVVDLDRSAGSPADVLLNGRLIAHGEVVVVDQDYAVRITKILDTAETVG